MEDRTALLYSAIMSSTDYFALMDEDSTDRDSAFRKPRFRLGYSFLHERICIAGLVRKHFGPHEV